MTKIFRTYKAWGLASAILVGASVLLTLIWVASLDSSTGPWPNIVVLLGSVMASIIGFYFGQTRTRVRDKLRKRQVFIVHSYDDLSLARELADAVRSAGFQAWLDVDEVTPGESIREQIDRAVRTSSMALYIPPSGAPSSFVESELRAIAMEITSIDRRSSPVVPVLVGDRDRSTVPDWLSDVAPLSLSNPNWRTELSRTLNLAFHRGSTVT